jgi:acetyltransferase-like isoleucine patch superfamily enzyme
MGKDPGKIEAVLVPRQGVNDDVATLIHWEVDDRRPVRRGDVLAVMETTKTAFELECPEDGYVVHNAQEGNRLEVGSVLAFIVGSQDTVVELLAHSTPTEENPASDSQIVTRKAREIIDREKMDMGAFADLPVVREEDVIRTLNASSPPLEQQRQFRGQPLDLKGDWDDVLTDPLLGQTKELLTKLRRRMRAKFNRHVSTGDLLYDRWDLARDYGFGKGTSVYDDALILGDVQVGQNCWIGPHTIIDGSGGLRIGDFVDVGAGAQIYSHNTIQRSLTRHAADTFHNPTRIGDCCFIAPNAIIAAGTVLESHSFVAALSYVEGRFPPYSFVEGNPARRVGEIVVNGNVARVVRFRTAKDDDLSAK